MGNYRFFYVLCSAIVLVFAFLGYLFSPKEFDENILLLVLIAAGGLIALYVFSKEEYSWLKGQTVKCSSLFLFAFTVVSFQIYVDVLLGNVSPDDPFLMLRSSLICKVAFLSLSGLSAFLCGYFWQKGKIYVSRGGEIVPLGPLIVFTTVLFPVWFFIMGPAYFTGGYGIAGRLAGVERNAFASYVALIMELMIYAIPFLHAKNLRSLRIRPSLWCFIRGMGWYNAIVVSYLLLEISSGERDVIIRALLSLGVSYFWASGFKVSRKLFCILLFSAALVLTTLGIARDFNIGGSFSEKISMAIESERPIESVFPQGQELAASVRCVHAVVDAVPSKHPHLFGGFQLQHIISPIPTGNRWCQIVGILPAKWQYGGAANFVTWLRQGDNPSYGDGTAVLVDLYLDFGILGVVSIMFLFGFWVRRFDVNLYSPYMCPTPLLAASFIYTIASVYITRSSILHELKHAVWLFIVIYVYEHAFGKKSIRSN